jgi:hypothetical protein
MDLTSQRIGTVLRSLDDIEASNFIGEKPDSETSGKTSAETEDNS